MDGVFGAGEELGYLIIMIFAERLQVFGDEKSVVEAAGADVTSNSRERDEVDLLIFDVGESLI